MKIPAARPYIAESLQFAFHPHRIAVIGASRYAQKPGFEVVKALLDRNYRGDILPVNPHAKEIQGLPAYQDVGSIQGQSTSPSWLFPPL
jgi:acyl-CoA synthetase (NDP forming)